MFAKIAEKLAKGELVDKYSLDRGRLIYQDDVGHRYYVPQAIAQEVVAAYHSQCHPGVPKLMSMLGRRYIFSMKTKQLSSLSGLPSSEA